MHLELQSAMKIVTLYADIKLFGIMTKRRPFRGPCAGCQFLSIDLRLSKFQIFKPPATAVNSPYQRQADNKHQETDSLL